MCFPCRQLEVASKKGLKTRRQKVTRSTNRKRRKILRLFENNHCAVIDKVAVKLWGYEKRVLIRKGLAFICNSIHHHYNIPEAHKQSFFFSLITLLAGFWLRQNRTTSTSMCGIIRRTKRWWWRDIRRATWWRSIVLDGWFFGIVLRKFQWLTVTIHFRLIFGSVCCCENLISIMTIVGTLIDDFSFLRGVFTSQLYVITSDLRLFREFQCERNKCNSTLYRFCWIFEIKVCTILSLNLFSVLCRLCSRELLTTK